MALEIATLEGSYLSLATWGTDSSCGLAHASWWSGAGRAPSLPCGWGPGVVSNQRNPAKVTERPGIRLQEVTIAGKLGLSLAGFEKGSDPMWQGNADTF